LKFSGYNFITTNIQNISLSQPKIESQYTCRLGILYIYIIQNKICRAPLPCAYAASVRRLSLQLRGFVDKCDWTRDAWRLCQTQANGLACKKRADSKASQPSALDDYIIARSLSKSQAL
jgi:hypothetical protein